MIINPSIVAILAGRVSCNGNKVVITAQLERKEYLKVNEVLESLGGKWSRSAKAHVFPDGVAVAEMLKELVASGEVLSRKKDLSFYPTKDSLADEMVYMAQIPRGATVLEPSAGDGAIARAILRNCPSANLCLVEVDASRREVLDSFENAVVHCPQDFLTLKPSPCADRIVANPPFNGGVAIAHVERMLDWLSPKGRLVCLLPSTFPTLQTKQAIRVKAKMNKRGFVDYHPVNPGAFKEVGTDVNVVCMYHEKSS